MEILYVIIPNASQNTDDWRINFNINTMETKTTERWEEEEAYDEGFNGGF